MILTPAQKIARASWHFTKTGFKWFKLYPSCSFSDGDTEQHVTGIRIRELLLALDEAGYLAQWDRKAKKLKR